MVTTPVTEALVRDWLEEVPDPEIPVLSVVELGIIQQIICAAEQITVVVTPTYSGCPALEVMKRSIAAKVRERSGLPVVIEVALSPRWTTDRIPLAAREKLRRYGIAPPCSADGGDAGGERPLVQLPTKQQRLSCPHCGSSDTHEIAHFGSTPCKSLFSCASCLQPFEHFKAI